MVRKYGMDGKKSVKPEDSIWIICPVFVCPVHDVTKSMTKLKYVKLRYITRECIANTLWYAFEPRFRR